MMVDDTPPCLSFFFSSFFCDLSAIFCGEARRLAAGRPCALWQPRGSVAGGEQWRKRRRKSRKVDVSENMGMGQNLLLPHLGE